MAGSIRNIVAKATVVIIVLTQLLNVLSLQPEVVSIDTLESNSKTSIPQQLPNRNLRGAVLTKLLRDTYLSDALLESGFHAVFQSANLSQTCSQDVMLFAKQIMQLNGGNFTSIDTWALQMLDAWAKIPEGILSGHVNALGDYDECLAVRGPRKDNSNFRGQYCLMYTIPNIGEIPGADKLYQGQPGERSVQNLLKVLSVVGNTELPLIPSIGSCLPSTCSDQESLAITRALLHHMKLVPVAAFCSTDQPEKMKTGTIATLSTLGIIGILIIFGTLFDVAVRYKFISSSSTSRKLPSAALLAFSLATNGTKLLNTQTSPNDVSCLHGIRFLSASWVVLGHTYLMGIIQPMWNIVETYSVITTSVSFLFIINATIVVDVFFVVGGFLVALSLLALLEKSKGRMNIPLLYIHRYLRITPMYMMILFSGTFVFPLLGNGPYWHVSKTWAGFCEKNWWKNLLYINNLPIYNSVNDPNDAPCHGMAWYLGVDMQLFLLSPFLLFPVWKWKRYGAAPLALLTVLSIMAPGVLTYVNDYIPMSVPFIRKENKFSQEAYTPTYMRATPYLIGMLTGIYFQWIRNRPFKLTRTFVACGWLLTVIVSIILLLSPYKFVNPEYQFKAEESAIFVVGHRLAWSMVISWLIFACGTGNGGWINSILSWRPFVPLGRLTFAIYLVSMHLQFLFHLQARQPIYFSNYHMVNLFFAHLVMSCIVAMICTLTIEAPFMQLLKLIMPTGSKPKSKATSRKVNNNNENEPGRESVSPSPDPTEPVNRSPSPMNTGSQVNLAYVISR